MSIKDCLNCDQVKFTEYVQGKGVDIDCPNLDSDNQCQEKRNKYNKEIEEKLSN